MQLLKKILLFLFAWAYFFYCIWVSAFLWEDLGLNFYEQIDEGFYELEKKQYEYEITGQWETTIQEVINPILADSGVECDINTTDEIDRAIWKSENEPVAFVLERCGGWSDSVPSEIIGRAMSGLEQIKRDFMQRATEKSLASYKIARVGLYSDGNIENSSFDLMRDLEEIDKVIFTQELGYEGEEYEKSEDQKLEDHLKKKNTPDDSDNTWTEGKENDTEDTTPWSSDDTPSGDIPVFPIDVYWHQYVCAPEDESGLNDDILDDVYSDLWRNRSGSTRNISYPHYFELGEWVSYGAWGWPFPNLWPAGTYSEVKDEWGCQPSDFFCIIIEFVQSKYGLIWGQTRSIEAILSKVAKHLEKPANASITQHKMTTNNFELWNIIKNLPDMLRGFGIEVSSQPVPILDLESEKWKNIQGDQFAMKNMLQERYKNMGMDYERRNDLDIYESSELETKVLQTAGGLSPTYVESKMNELTRFQRAMRNSNRQISLEVDKQVLHDDMREFGNQFTELERFVASILHFSESVTGSVQQFKKIPTRSP